MWGRVRGRSRFVGDPSGCDAVVVLIRVGFLSGLGVVWFRCVFVLYGCVCLVGC